MEEGADAPVEVKTIKALTTLSLKRTYDLFAGNYGQPIPFDEESQQIKIACKIRSEYSASQHLSATAPAASRPTGPIGPAPPPGSAAAAEPEPVPVPKVESRSAVAKLIDSIPTTSAAGPGAQSTALVVGRPGAAATRREVAEVLKDRSYSSAAVSRRLASKWPAPEWHPPWKLYRVISGHLGWVKSVAVEPGNEWFCTGSSDRTIKIWDLASGQLKLTLTGHIESVTGLAVSKRMPYMFSCGNDKTVKCWDLEQNKVIRSYHGHLSGVYCLALHPTLDLLFTGGRDSTCRVWDIRTKVQVHCLSGHENTVGSVFTEQTDPQVVTGSHDSTIRLWDLRKARTMSTLTFHKKSIRAMAPHPHEYTFASASADNIKKFKLPEGDFLHNMLSHPKAIVNAMALNEDGVLVTGTDTGNIWFWDWKSGHCFQQTETIVQPGSLESEAGIFATTFDQTGSRLISCEADKTIKMWREDEAATKESAPGLPFRPPKDIKRF